MIGASHVTSAAQLCATFLDEAAGTDWAVAVPDLEMSGKSRTAVAGTNRFDAVLPRAPIHKPTGGSPPSPGSGDTGFWDRVQNPREDFYRDVQQLGLQVERLQSRTQRLRKRLQKLRER